MYNGECDKCIIAIRTAWRAAEDGAVAMSPASLLQHDKEERLGELHGGKRLQENRLLQSTSREHASCLDTALELLLRSL